LGAAGIAEGEAGGGSDPKQNPPREAAEVQLGARRTKLIVKRMKDGVVMLADVAILRIDDFAKFGITV